MDSLPIPTDLRVVPSTCPIGWSAKDRHGHSRTDRQACRPGWQHVALVAETSLISKRSCGEVRASASATQPGILTDSTDQPLPRHGQVEQMGETFS